MMRIDTPLLSFDGTETSLVNGNKELRERLLYTILQERGGTYVAMLAADCMYYGIVIRHRHNHLKKGRIKK